MDDIQDIVGKLLLELRRGAITLSIISQLAKPKYGYSLVESMQEKGMPVEPGTLYPLLRRLEKQGLLISEWEMSQAKPRKYYVLSDTGKKVYELLCDEWNNMTSCINSMIEERNDENGK